MSLTNSKMKLILSKCELGFTMSYIAFFKVENLQSITINSTKKSIFQNQQSLNTIHHFQPINIKKHSPKIFQ